MHLKELTCKCDSEGGLVQGNTHKWGGVEEVSALFCIPVHIQSSMQSAHKAGQHMHLGGSIQILHTSFLLHILHTSFISTSFCV